MVVVTASLLVVVLLKILAVVNAIRWLHSRGLAFAVALAEQPPRTVDDQERMYDRLGADFFPFGVKDYRLRRTARRSRGPRRFLVGWPAQVFRTLLFNLALLTVLATAYLIVLASVPSAPDLLPRPVHDAVALALAMSLIVATILIAVEAVYGYAVLGSYGMGFHELRPERREPERALVREFQVFVGALIAAYLAGVGAMYLIGHRFGGYGRIPMSTPGPAQAARETLDCSYYTLTTFIGASDPEPLTAAGKVASGLVALQGFAFLALVLASMLSIAGDERARHVHAEPVTQPATRLPADTTKHPGETAAHRDPPRRPAASEPKPLGMYPFVLGAAAGATSVLAVLAWARGRHAGHHRTSE